MDPKVKNKIDSVNSLVKQLKLTKSEKISILEKTIERIKYISDLNQNPYICPSIKFVMIENEFKEFYLESPCKNYDYLSQNLFKIFPELLFIKPDNCDLKSSWWIMDDVQSNKRIRVEKINQIIQMMKSPWYCIYLLYYKFKNKI